MTCLLKGLFKSGLICFQGGETHSKLLKFGCRTFLYKVQGKVNQQAPGRAYEDSREVLAYLLLYYLAYFIYPLLPGFL